MQSIFAYAFLVFAVLALTHIPLGLQEKIRSYAIDALLPYEKSSSLQGISRKEQALQELEKEKARLVAENYNLQSQLSSVYEWLLFDERLQEEAKRMCALRKKQGEADLYWKSFFQKRSEELKSLIEMKLQALPAKVIYREPSSWGSSVWINVGKRNNAALEKEIIAKNSPVVVGNHLVGVVEFVDTSKSRVRLITDSGLAPSVRALRGKPQDEELLKWVDGLLVRLQAKPYAYQTTIQELLSFKEHFSIQKEELYLAKGEIQGSSKPLWSSQSVTLYGRGFNYAYSDSKGPSRDLHTGLPSSIEAVSKKKRAALLQEGDLLATTGMDGVFPEGLFVGAVTKVYPLEQGAYYYSIEAQPTCATIDRLDTVFVLPKLSSSSMQE